MDVLIKIMRELIRKADMMMAGMGLPLTIMVVMAN
jgi:hypothetical protein